MSSPQEIFCNSVWSILSSLHTCLPGIIRSYDPSQNKASIQPALNKNYQSGVQPMPILENVPLVFPSTANFSMTYPVSEGDYVLLLFSERSLDLWKSVGGQVTPDDNRKFHLSDAIAIPGLQPFNGNNSNNNGTDFLIDFAGSSIRIKADGAIEIKTGSTVAIGNPIVELLDVVSQILGFIANPVGVSVPAVPFTGPLVDATTAAALKIQLDTIKGTIT